jgi:hypothetical protein
MMENLTRLARQLICGFEYEIKTACADKDNDSWYGGIDWRRVAFVSEKHNLELVWRFKALGNGKSYAFQDFHVRIKIKIKKSKKFLFWDISKTTSAFLLLSEIADGDELREYHLGIVENLLVDLRKQFLKEPGLIKAKSQEETAALIEVLRLKCLGRKRPRRG